MAHSGTLAACLIVFVAAAQAARPQGSAAPPGKAAEAPLTPEGRGDLAMVRQEYVTAIEFYRQAPQDSAAVWNKMGMAWHHLFAMAEAKRDYERALRLRPDFPEALNNLGAVYYAEQNYRKAIELYRKALALNPKSAAMYSNLGTAWFAEQNYDEGLVAYQKAFALDPTVFNDSNALEVNEPVAARRRAQQDYCIARIFAQSGKTEKALDYLRRALNEGFEDRRKILEDRTLSSLRAMPEFAKLMSEQEAR